MSNTHPSGNLHVGLVTIYIHKYIWGSKYSSMIRIEYRLSSMREATKGRLISYLWIVLYQITEILLWNIFPCRRNLIQPHVFSAHWEFCSKYASLLKFESFGVYTWKHEIESPEATMWNFIWYIYWKVVRCIRSHRHCTILNAWPEYIVNTLNAKALECRSAKVTQLHY